MTEASSVVTDPRALGTILGVWAHPDDETYLSAGVMAAAVRGGRRVVCCSATRGEAGSLDEERWPPDTLAKVREAELVEALGHLGVSEHLWLDYVDGTCHLVPDEEGTAKVARLIADIGPDSILTFGPEGMTGHPDHKAVFRWTLAAFEGAGKPGARLYRATVTPEWAEEFRPLSEPFNIFYEDDTPPQTPRDELAIEFAIPADLLEVKWRALTSQRSQTEGLIAAMGAEAVQRFNSVEMFALAATR